MDRRLMLDEELRALLRENFSTVHIYFQPPESIKLKYPCIVYNRQGYDVRRANNYSYNVQTQYDVTFITRDIESEFPRKILEHFRMISPGRNFVRDNLYHFPFTLYY